MNKSLMHFNVAAGTGAATFAAMTGMRSERRISTQL